VKLYYGLKDPAEHLEMSRAHIILNRMLGEMAYRAFPLTLVGSTTRRGSGFVTLPLESVGSFEDLRRLFLSPFMAWQRRRKLPSYLLIVKQRETESFKDSNPHPKKRITS
jgi:hypothetical protein